MFGDSFYWIALIDPGDDWHDRVVEVSQALGATPIVTTEAVLTEVLNAFASRHSGARAAAVDVVADILQDPQVETLPLAHGDFLAGFSLYRDRPDKQYSLTDCISMNVMRGRAIQEALTRDRHFEQEGFVRLFRE